MAKAFVVREPFTRKDPEGKPAHYQKGAIIDDPALVAALDVTHSHHLIAITIPDAKPAASEG